MFYAAKHLSVSVTLLTNLRARRSLPTRKRGQASQLINRLHQCAFGEISLTVTQLRAIEILLRKSIPDLAAAEIRSEQTYRYVVELPPVLSRDEWQRKYGLQ